LDSGRRQNTPKSALGSAGRKKRTVSLSGDVWLGGMVFKGSFCAFDYAGRLYGCHSRRRQLRRRSWTVKAAYFMAFGAINAVSSVITTYGWPHGVSIRAEQYQSAQNHKKSLFFSATFIILS